jgi:mono/diheme cytochrome c family protein
MNNLLKIFPVLLINAIFLPACSTRRSAAIRGDFVPENARTLHGQAVYSAYCYKCHPGGEAGLGPSTNAVPAPNFLRKFQVRHGLGAMPSFKHSQLSSTDLNDLVHYITARRHYKGSNQ